MSLFNFLIYLSILFLSSMAKANSENAWADLDLSVPEDAAQATVSVPPPDQAILERLRYQELSSSIGMPEKSDGNILTQHNGYSSGGYLEQLLKSVGEFEDGRFVYTLPLGPAITELYSQAKIWVNEPQVFITEIYPKIMLNRCVDFFQLVLPVSGANTDEVRRVYANFWYKCYVHAIAYANSNLVVTHNAWVDSRWPGLSEAVRRYVSAYSQVSPSLSAQVLERSMAQFAYEQAQFFYKSTTTEISSEAQTVGLIRLLGYLGRDMAQDQRHRHPAIVQTRSDIRRIRSSMVYTSLLGRLREGQAFTSEQKQTVRVLRLQIHRLLGDIPARLQSLEVNLVK